jgi:hypothetical protein
MGNKKIIIPFSREVPMKRILLVTAAMLAFAVPANADLIGDPLHGTICNASGAACNAAEVGGVVPGSFGAGNTFGFNSSPAGATGDLWIALLVPTNELGGFVTPNLVSLGVDPGTKLLGFSGIFSAASPDLANVIFGGSANGTPSNPFSAFSTPESIQDPGLTAFSVFAWDVGAIGGTGLNGQSALTAPDFFSFSGGSNLPPGSAITAFMVNGTDVTSTAPSGQISALAVPGPIVGAGLPGLLSAFGLLTLNRRRQLREWWRKFA